MATTTTQAKKHLLSVRISVLNTVQILRILPPYARHAALYIKLSLTIVYQYVLYRKPP